MMKRSKEMPGRSGSSLTKRNNIFTLRASLLFYAVLQCCFFVLSDAQCDIEPDGDGHVVIPTTWTSIPYTAFSDCNLQSVTIPDSVTKINERAFMDCKNLTSVAIPGSVKNIESEAFRGCSELVNVTFGNGVEKIYSRAFYDCRSLQSVNLPDSVTKLETEAFRNCALLQSVAIGEGLVGIGSGSFFACGSLESVTMGDSVTTIHRNAFRGCLKLKSVHLGKSVKNIDSGAFSYSLRLQSIDLPNGLEKIGDVAFSVSGLTSVTIPSSVQKISTGAFYEVVGLQSVTIEASSQQLYIDSHVFGSNSELTEVTIMSPDIMFLGDPFTDTPNIRLLRFSRSATYISGLPLSRGIICSTSSGSSSSNSSVRCGCVKGYENLMPAISSMFTCSPCELGFSNDVEASLGLCDMCVPGRYAPRKASEICELCEEGKFGTDYSATSSLMTCRACPLGKYASSPGSSTCIPCPAGSFCPSSGTVEYTECIPGTFNSFSSQVQCKSCPSGTYGNFTGAAVCLDCPSGKYWGGVGASDVSFCVDCPAGRFGDKGGLAECSQCPTGQVQPGQGQTSCEECTLEGKIKTNAAHTECIDEQALLSTSVVSFDDGSALYGVFLPILTLFCALGIMIEWARRAWNRATAQNNENNEKGVAEPVQKLAQLGFFLVFAKTAGMGLALSADIFEIATHLNSGGLAEVIIVLRLLHTLSMCFLLVVIIGPLPIRERMSKSGSKFLQDASSWSEDYHYDFAKTNFEKAALVFMVCAYDISMAQFLPWKDTPYYRESKGYARESMMLFIGGVDIIQKSLSALSYIVSLLVTGGNSNSVVGLYVSVMISLSSAIISSCQIYFKDSIKEMLISSIVKDDEKRDSESERGDDIEMHHPGIELGAIYPDEMADGQVRDTDNPLHSIAKEQNV